MFVDELDYAIRSLTPAPPRSEKVEVFGDLIWGERSLPSEPALLYERGTRYVVVWRWPAGIRYFGAPAPCGTYRDENNRDSWDTGVLPDIASAARYVIDWLAGTAPARIEARRRAPPWLRKPAPWHSPP